MPSAKLWTPPEPTSSRTRTAGLPSGLAWLLALVATAGSLSLSGIPAVGWTGQGLVPCELCWYQRILMYPLAVILGLEVLADDRDLSGLALSLAVPGTLLAGYHSLLQVLPSLEVGQCVVGACSATLWTLGGTTVPNLSLIAFAGVSVLLAWPSLTA